MTSFRRAAPGPQPVRANSCPVGGPLVQAPLGAPAFAIVFVGNLPHRQQNPERTAVPRCAAHTDTASQRADNALYNSQTQSSAHEFGCEEGIENLRLHLLAHARAGIQNLNRDILAGGKLVSKDVWLAIRLKDRSDR